MGYWGRVRKFIQSMGPAWIIAADASGPATLASLCIAGAAYGYSLLWVVILSIVFGATAQYLAVRIGVLEGRGIIATTRERLGKIWGWVLTIDALLVTWLAALVLMNAICGVTSLITGIDTPLWGIPYAVLVAGILIRGGYHWFEKLCKLLIVVILVSFVITLLMADVSWTNVAHGLIPNIPGGMQSALMMAAIMGGAVHITIIGMHTYNCNAKNWTRKDLKLARLDNFLSMGLAFGLYSIVIFFVAAAVLHPHNIRIATATDAALSLEPLLGQNAARIFMLGLWGAAFSTLSPTILAGVYFFSDHMQWPLFARDKRMNWAIVAGCALAALGPLLKGGFFLLLPLMLALGLCGTPLVIAIILYLLNRKKIVGEDTNSLILNVLGFVTLGVTTILVVRFVILKLGLL
ncbi:MAG: divalent metal cation transporter [Deltaproteobacteria bacterium]|nr:divalent metal cation transporter [Deltaproteobacteria bacterium]